MDELVNYLNAIVTGYRTELRGLAELHFSRFDAKLEQRITQLKADIEKQLTALDTKIERVASDLRADRSPWPPDPASGRRYALPGQWLPGNEPVRRPAAAELTPVG